MPRAGYRWRGLAALALLLISSSALALGLGEIRVKSAPGQPLLAEIPIISTEPGELEQLRAQLASPTTFERVGLPRPTGLVGNLDFAVALDEAGRPVIRVTTQEPVTVPVLNFLVEVDWGQGRLVREYSAMVDSPGAVAAAAQPVIDAPQAAPEDAIVRPAEPPVAAVEPAPPADAPPAPAPTTAAPAGATTAVPPAPAPAAQAGDQLTVARGQTLSAIARDIGGGSSLDQTMIALLRANPEAFIGGNINRLKQGAVLRIPASEEVARLGQIEAAALVRNQIDEWRQARRPIPQPAAIAANTASPAAEAPSRTAEARLEIAPPLAGAAARAGTQSGVEAGGEGDMLANEQLQQSKEDLAARESEVQELRAQVAELEKLKQQQDKLIAMKDSDLAAAQQRLAQSNDPSQGASQGTPLWAWIGWALLVVGALAWLISSRRQRTSPPKPASRKPLFEAPVATAAPAVPEQAEEAPAPEAPREPAPAVAPAIPVTPAAPVKPNSPTWHSGGEPAADPVARVAPLNPAPAGRERLELAVAYLDLGDTVTARDLLNEVAAGNDETARQEALQLLRDLG
ncbi:type IV pilus assembly protein FimV [Pseudoxanthomonas beigongshangi]|uniref:type IV pilus assembly protein FimV n=1 Tax=Pseudoxanthomonas beigongshangi TaxID=2782537 RepID=UPI00193BB88E|nr:FimV/HubP family polar landmark protein [Pseudoxanthomonas beigongshangi]